MKGKCIKETPGFPAFTIGDVVTVGDVKNCVYGYNDVMRSLRGTDIRVVDVLYDSMTGTYCYICEPLELDDVGDIYETKRWRWDVNCFTGKSDAFYDSPEIEVSSAKIFENLLGIC